MELVPGPACAGVRNGGRYTGPGAKTIRGCVLEFRFHANSPCASHAPAARLSGMARNAATRRKTAGTTGRSTPPRVALLVAAWNEYGRGIIEGVWQYAQQHGPWFLEMQPSEPDENTDVPRGWAGDGVIATTGSARPQSGRGDPPGQDRAGARPARVHRHPDLRHCRGLRLQLRRTHDPRVQEIPRLHAVALPQEREVGGVSSGANW